jgi:hypothetical protein
VQGRVPPFRPPKWVSWVTVSFLPSGQGLHLSSLVLLNDGLGGLAVLFLTPRRSLRSPTPPWSEAWGGAGSRQAGPELASWHGRSIGWSAATGRIVILAGTHRVHNSPVNRWHQPTIANV